MITNSWFPLFSWNLTVKPLLSKAEGAAVDPKDADRGAMGEDWPKQMTKGGNQKWAATSCHPASPLGVLDDVEWLFRRMVCIVSLMDINGYQMIQPITFLCTVMDV